MDDLISIESAVKTKRTNCNEKYNEQAKQQTTNRHRQFNARLHAHQEREKERKKKKKNRTNIERKEPLHHHNDAECALIFIAVTI